MSESDKLNSILCKLVDRYRVKPTMQLKIRIKLLKRKLNIINAVKQ